MVREEEGSAVQTGIEVRKASAATTERRGSVKEGAEPFRGRWFSVTIIYREPTFELYAAAARRPREGTFRLSAETKEAAVEGAMRTFRTIEALSWVDWPRVVESVAVVSLRCIDGGGGSRDR
jgi:hypothetical protein